MTLSEYVRKRNGVSIGDSRSLRNNLHRSLGAKNFSSFWNYWNPIFGYYLGIYIFKPLKKVIPLPWALLLTFVFCGMIHDVVTTLYRGKTSFFFSIWFFFMAIAVLITRLLKHDFSDESWLVRALINVGIIGVCFAVTWLVYKVYLVR